MSENILFFISSLGAFNTLLLGSYTLYKSKFTDRFFLFTGLFLICVSIRVGISCLYFFDKEIHPYVIQLGLTSNTIAAAFLYVLLKVDHQKNRIHYLGVPATLVLFGVLFPFADYFIIWDHHIRFVLHTIVTTYIIASYFRLRSLSKNPSKEYFSLKKLLFIAFSLTCLFFAVSLFTNYIFGPILFSLTFYAVLLYYFRQYKTQKKFQKEKYYNKKIDPPLAQELLQELQQYLLHSEAFKNPNIKVYDIATELNISKHQLSQLLNDNLGVNFSNYINNFRVEQAKRLLLTNTHFTIEAIGYEAGFNSKTTFFTTFKQIVGVTPKVFKDQKVVQD